ncbi:MAG: LamG domain-containing protein [Calothrix sp. SM1_5_4]|nr:LamG domain-containing protein [Calothrix sp. SM1_5_4]
MGSTNVPSGSSPRTYMSWVRVSSVPNAAGYYGGVVIGSNAASGQQKFHLEMIAIGATWYLFTDGINGSNNISLAVSERPAIGEWAHIAFSLGQGNAWKYYLNGRLTRSGTFAVPINTGAISSVTIGMRTDYSASYVMSGNIDDAAIWNMELSGADIGMIYNRQKQKYAGSYDSPIIDMGADGAVWTSLEGVTSLPFFKELPGGSGSESATSYPSLGGSLMSGLSGYWPLNGVLGSVSNGSAVSDFSGYARHGVADNAGSGMFYQPGKLSAAMEFDGVNDRVELGTILNQGVQSFTLSAWARSTSAALGNNNGIIYKRGTGSSFQPGYRLNFPNGRFNFHIADGVAYASVTSAESGLNDGAWHHVAAIRRTATATVEIYVNGKLSASAADAVGSVDSTMPLAIGALTTDGSNVFHPFAGQIDEVAVWSRALRRAKCWNFTGAGRIALNIRFARASIHRANARAIVRVRRVPPRTVTATELSMALTRRTLTKRSGLVRMARIPPIFQSFKTTPRLILQGVRPAS